MNTQTLAPLARDFEIERSARDVGRTRAGTGRITSIWSPVRRAAPFCDEARLTEPSVLQILWSTNVHHLECRAT